MTRFIAILMMVAMVAGTAMAGEIVLSDSRGTGVSIVSETMEKGDMTLKMSFSMDKLYFERIGGPANDFTMIYSPDLQFGGEYGGPQIPVITKLVQIPFGAELNVQVKGYDSEVYNLTDYGISDPIVPRQPSAPKDGSEVPFVYDRSAYMFRGFRGEEITKIEDLGVMRDMRLALVTISPVEYDPVDNKIRVFNNVDFDITLAGADIEQSKDMHDKYNTPAFSWMNNMVESPKSLQFESKNKAESYLIVADRAFQSALVPFVDWKTKMGYVVETVYVDEFGSTADEMRNGVQAYIKGLYNEPPCGMTAPSYVLFVGDNDNVPAFKGKTGSHISDLYYVAVTEGDNLPDILTGRFSARNVKELTPQIEKTLYYEQFKFADPSFLDDVVLTAGWDYSWARSHGWPHINYAEKYYFNKSKGFDKVYKYLSAGSGQNVSKIISNISDGVSYVNYTAHGSSTTWSDPRLTISNINSLNNEGKYPFIIGNCCLTNKFEVSTCFGEAWLRAEDQGAIGYVGGTNSTYWDEDIWWGIGLHSIKKPNNEGIAPDISKTGTGAIDTTVNNISNAGFMNTGTLAVEASTSGRKLYYWEVYLLMGDPSLKTYFGQPGKLDVNHVAELDGKSNTVNVNAPAGSYVGISSNGALLGSGYVGANGSADIALNNVPADGTADIVVTRSNSVPYIGTINL